MENMDIDVKRKNNDRLSLHSAGRQAGRQAVLFLFISHLTPSLSGMKRK